jgi:anti-sigma regulatory factor (Ser/Thr protein kinase)
MERTIHVDATPAAPAQARREVAQALGEAAVPSETVETSQLLISELVTNTVRHGDCGPSDDIELRLTCDRESVHVEVHQQASVEGVRVVRQGRLERGCGWGLSLVETLASDWGVSRVPPCVWFTVAA